MSGKKYIIVILVNQWKVAGVLRQRQSTKGNNRYHSSKRKRPPIISRALLSINFILVFGF